MTSLSSLKTRYGKLLDLDPILIADGQYPGIDIINKFGRAIVSNTFTPVCFGGFYRTPQVGSETAFRIKAGNANDAANGSGAREITAEIIDTLGDKKEIILPTNGASAGAASSETGIRIVRAIVSKSGTYGTQSVGSQAADVVIENAAGTEDWVTIDASQFPNGQSEIGVYTIPRAHCAFLTYYKIIAQSNKAVSIRSLVRKGILKTSAPYDAIRNQVSIPEFTDRSEDFIAPFPLSIYDELTDVGIMAKVDVGTAEVGVFFQLLQINKELAL